MKEIIILFFVFAFGWTIYVHSKTTGGAVRDSAPVRCYEKVGKKYTRLPAWRCGYRTGVIHRADPQTSAPSVPARTMDSVPQAASTDLQAVDNTSRWANLDLPILRGLWGHESRWNNNPNGVGPRASASSLIPACVARKTKPRRTKTGLVKPGMARGKAATYCAATYKAAKAALVHMCTGQGRVICDPDKARMQWAGDSGPFQIVVQHVFPKKKDGTFGRAPWAVDADGDGVVNLFNLRDAAATAAMLLHWKYNNQCKKSNVRCAVNYYWGSEDEVEPGKQYYDIVLEWGSQTCQKKPQLCTNTLLASK